MLLLALEICITFLDFIVVVRMMLQISTYKYKEIIHFFGPKDTIFWWKNSNVLWRFMTGERNWIQGAKDQAACLSEHNMLVLWLDTTFSFSKPKLATCLFIVSFTITDK